MLDAIESLSKDHRIIERVLDCLERATQRLQASESVRADFFIDAADFIRDFADGCHHRKEEEALFPALEAAGIPRFGGPVGVMLGEHDDGRGYAAVMREAAEKLKSENAGDVQRVIQSAQQYVALMRQHIYKEDNVLFMVAQRVLDPLHQAALAETFDFIERETEVTRSKYILLAQTLELEMGQRRARAA